MKKTKSSEQIFSSIKFYFAYFSGATTLKLCMYEWVMNWFILSKGKDMCMRTIFICFFFKKYAWHFNIYMSLQLVFFSSFIVYSEKTCVLDKWPPLPVTSYFSKNLFCRERSFSQNIIFHAGKQIWKIFFLLLVLSDYHLLEERNGKSFKKVVAFWEDREVQL